MKRLCSLLLALLVIFLAFFSTQWVYSQDATRVRVFPAQVTLQPGRSAAIEIWVDDVEALFAFEADIHFDPDLLSAKDLTLGSFLEPGQEAINLIDNDNGIIQYHMTQWGQNVASKSGSGVLFSFEITLLDATAGSDIDIEHILLSDRDSFEIPCEVQHGMVKSPGSGPEFSVYLPLILH